MSIRMLSGRIAVVFLAALAAGCSSTKTTGSGTSSTSSSLPSASARSSSAQVTDSCKSNRRKCLYEGSYESGERDYAEQEAKRLNLAELERLRRAFGN